MKRFAWLAAVTLVACSAPMPMMPPLEPGEVVPDFSLRDENPASPTSGQQVSPRDFEGKVTGWYFGHSS